MTKDPLINESQRIKPKKNTNQILLALLNERCLKQSDLARIVSVDRAYINRIVHGAEQPPITLMIKIAKALNVDSRIIFPEKCYEVVNKNG